MEIFSLAIVLVFVLITVYALVKLVKFFITDSAAYSYQTIQDDGIEYDHVIDHTESSKKHEE